MILFSYLIFQELTFNRQMQMPSSKQEHETYSESSQMHRNLLNLRSKYGVPTSFSGRAGRSCPFMKYLRLMAWNEKNIGTFLPEKYVESVVRLIPTYSLSPSAHRVGIGTFSPTTTT
jgi:hypothetical protein